tara:strand:+ start:23 stop:520 length:498 start_codon:yes stop_codon:yes gene_type:complete
MPIKYNESIKEKARYYYLNGESYAFIIKSLKEEYDVDVSKGTLSKWKQANKWEDSKKRIREEVVNGTEQKATQTLGRRLKVLDNLELQFIKKLSMFKEDKVLDIKPDEYIRIIREAERLQDAVDAKGVIVRLVSEKLPRILEQSGLTQKQINTIIRNWIEETKDI